MKPSAACKGIGERMVILKTLARGPNHGFGVAQHIQTVSRGLLRVEEGSLYPALHRLERDELVRSEWRVSENSRRARYYSLIASGRKRLAEAEQGWAALRRGRRRACGTTICGRIWNRAEVNKREGLAPQEARAAPRLLRKRLSGSGGGPWQHFSLYLRPNLLLRDFQIVSALKV